MTRFLSSAQEIAKRLSNSPLAGVYSFLLLFLFARITGEGDFLSFINRRLFPESDTYGIMLIQLSGVIIPGGDTQQTPPRADLILLRHSSKNSQKVTILRSEKYAEPPGIMIGSSKLKIIPDVRGELIMDPLPILDVEVPPESLLAVALTDDSKDSLLGTNQQLENKTYFTSGSVQKEFSDVGDLIQYTKNEFFNIRLLYTSFAVFGGLLGLTLPRFSNLRYPVDTSLKTQDEIGT